MSAACSFCGATPEQAATAGTERLCYPACYDAVVAGEPIKDGRTWNGHTWETPDEGAEQP